MDKDLMDKRTNFHVAKLALFNARVLARVQENSGSDGDRNISGILKECAETTLSNSASIPSTVNQSLYFGMAYLLIVWLWESLSREDIGKALESQRMENFWKRFEAKGPRQVTNAMGKMILIRNALSHAHVTIDDNFIFKFSDIDKIKKKEKEFTSIYMSNIDLGQLSDNFYYAVSDVLYPEN